MSDFNVTFEENDQHITLDFKEAVSTVQPMTEDVKQALLQLAEKVAYIDEDGQDYYDALYDALYPPVDLVSISAVYTQSGTVYDTDTLDSLKADLVVTAHMSDQTTQTVTDYVLSGTLTVGTSTITISYSGKTTTFSVTVSAVPTIKVFKGKGTSGTSISDNANRALSEPVYVGNVQSLFTKRDLTTVTDSLKYITTGGTIDTTGVNLVPQSYIGQTHAMDAYDAWRTTSENLCAAAGSTSTIWTYKVPESGYFRFLFKNVSSATSPITDPINGYVYINGDIYKFEEASASEFV